MKIIIINNLYSPWIRGGAERIAEKIIEGLEKQGHEVLVITTAPKESRTEKNYYLASIFYNLEKYPLWQRFFWHLWDIANFINRGKIKRFLAEHRPDLVITNNLQGVGYLVPGLLEKMKIRHFHILHDIQLLHPSGLMIWGKEKMIDTPAAKIYQAVMNFLMGSPALIISPSKWLLEEHEKRGFFKNSKKIILPNYFEGAGHKAQGIRSENNTFTFLYIGQIEKHKGVEFLIESFLKFLAESNAKAELSIIGSGSQSEEIKKMAGDEKEIKILGRKNEVEVRDLMLAADCLIVPSLCYENSPTVIYEAIAAQLPVIGAKIGGITELIEAAGGILFEPGNEDDLAERMAEVIKNSEKLNEIKTKEMAWSSPDYIDEVIRLAKD
ncbi:MAG: glycosyltransferase family 4 protein [Patescibacteria group bacterium]|nr:glycosyltransferase family 4 protein [Patescibacteria group bacterium]